jgi:hypothetical protein
VVSKSAKDDRGTRGRAIGRRLQSLWPVLSRPVSPSVRVFVKRAQTPGHTPARDYTIWIPVLLEV